MKKIFKRLALGVIAITMLASVTACSSAAEDDELYIFNTKGENADAMQAAADAFTEETGIKTKVFSLGSGTDSTEIMRTEINSQDKPAIFAVMNSETLVEWVESEYARPLSEGITDDFNALVDTIPSDLNLTIDGTANYGIPFNIEGYGYVVDTDMLADIFGVDGKSVADAIKTATYEEWEATVLALTDYIDNGNATSVVLSGQTFDMASTKTGKAETLEGVFSTAGSEKWTYGDHFVNVALNATFGTPYDASNATLSDVQSINGAMLAYAKALDLKTSNAVTERGADFINSTTNGYDQSVENLASGKAIFLKQGNWVYGNFANTSNPEIVDTLTFVPVKMPYNAEDVTAEGRTVEILNSSIPVFVPNYYIINDKVSEQEQEWAEQFLVWLNTSEAGQQFVTEEMNFIPYNADPATTTVGNSLGNSIIEYLASGDTISNPYAGAPTTWSTDILGGNIMENYLTKTEWTDQDYTDIANFAIDKWVEMKGLS